MKKKILGFIVLPAFIMAGIVIVPGAWAAIIVHDPQNTAENHATYLQAAQNTLNTATQIANQVLNLKSVSPEASEAHHTAINSELRNVSAVSSQSQGLSNPNKPAEQAWGQAFKPVNSYFDGSNNLEQTTVLANNQNMSHTLDQTLQDTLKTVRAYTDDISKDAELLRELMKQNQSAVGNKHAIQVQNDLIAQQNALYIKQNQIMAAMTVAIVANHARENQIEAQTLGINRKHIAEIDREIERISENEKRFQK